MLISTALSLRSRPLFPLLQSPALRLECARAAATACRFAKSGTLRKYVERIRELHEKGDESIRYIAGFAVLRLSKDASDPLKRFYGDVIPLAFMVRISRVSTSPIVSPKPRRFLYILAPAPVCFCVFLRALEKPKSWLQHPLA